MRGLGIGGRGEGWVRGEGLMDGEVHSLCERYRIPFCFWSSERGLVSDVGDVQTKEWAGMRIYLACREA